MRRRSILGAIITGYDEWVITISADPSTIENVGGTTTISSGATRIVHWSDKSTTIEYGIPTLSVSSGTLSGHTLTIGANTNTSIKTITITASYEGVTKTLDLSLAGKTIKSYTDWEVTVSANPSSEISAAGGTSTITSNASRIATWTDDSTTTETAVPTLSTNLGTIENSVLTLDPNQTTSTKTATITASHGGKSNTCTVTQNADTVATYGAVNLTTGTIADVPASGGSRTSTGSSATQTLTWVSGRSTTVYPTVTEGTISNVASKGSTISNRTSLGNVTVTAAGQGSKTASKTITAYLAANYVTGLSIATGTKSVAYSQAGAGASSSTKTESGNHSTTYTFTSGSTSTTTPSTTYGTLTWSTSHSMTASGNFTGINTSTGAVTVSSKGTSTSSVTTGPKVTITYSAKWTPSSSYSSTTINSNSHLLTAYPTQAANVQTLSSISIAAYLPDSSWHSTTWTAIPASGHYIGVRGTYHYTYTSGSTSTADAGNLKSGLTFTTSMAESWTNGGLHILSRGATTGDARSGTVYWTYGGKTSNTLSYTQVKNEVTNSNYSPFLNSRGTPTISIGSGISAGGGSATVTHSVKDQQGYYYYYTSGATSGPYYRDIAGTSHISIVSNGNSRFSLSGTKLSHSSMGTSATTDSVTVRAYNSNDTSKYKDASTSVANAITSYGAVSVSSHGSASDIPAKGGTIYGSGGKGTLTITYTSGSTRAGTVTCGSYSGVSANSLTTTLKDRTKIGDSKATLTGEGSKTATVSVAVYQLANTRSTTTSGGVTTYGNVTAGSITNATIPASGGSATATAGNGSQTWSKSAVVTTYTYTSGSTKNETTTAASSGTNTISPSVASYAASASSKGTTVSGVTTVGSKAVTWSGSGSKSASGTMYVYLAANAVNTTTTSVGWREVSLDTCEFSGTIYFNDINITGTWRVNCTLEFLLTQLTVNTYTSGASSKSYSDYDNTTYYTYSNIADEIWPDYPYDAFSPYVLINLDIAYIQASNEVNYIADEFLRNDMCTTTGQSVSTIWVYKIDTVVKDTINYTSKEYDTELNVIFTLTKIA